MPQIKLKPVEASVQEEDRLTKRIIALFEKEFFAPILKELGLKKSSIQNAKDDLIKAIRSGQLVYQKGYFLGKYSSTLTRELRGLGAKWDRKQGAWMIPLSNLPTEIQSEISQAEARFISRATKLDTLLSQVNPEKLAEKLDVKDIFDASLFKADKKISESLNTIGIKDELSKERAEKIATEYVHNLEKYIVGFTAEKTAKLREKIREATLKGIRYEAFISDIQMEYGVTLEKARFWARQENNLMVAKLRETRFRESGVTQYQWRTVAGSPNHPVRDSHKALNGKIFSWDKPPVTSDQGKPIRRNNPGEDYNCRCIAIPVVEF